MKELPDTHSTLFYFLCQAFLSFFCNGIHALQKMGEIYLLFSEKGGNMKKEIPQTQSEQQTTSKTKKHPILWFLFFIILVVLVGVGTAYYMFEKQKPEQTLKTFLGYVQTMNYEGMGSLLQSNDLSALDEAYVRNAAYAEFLEKINQKMTFEIVRNKFSIQNGTAYVTARIRHVDASGIYRDALNEFLRGAAFKAFSGTSMDNKQLQQELAKILNEKSKSIPDLFAEADVVYPLIQVNKEWKIVTLNEETIKIMSSDIKNIQNELQSLTTTQPDSSNSSSETLTLTESGSIDMTTEHFTIHYTLHRISKDFGENPCVLIYYDYTNHTNTPSSAMVNVKLTAYQNGTPLEATITAEKDSAIDQYFAEVRPEQTVNVCQVFLLNDQSDITLEASDAFGLDGGVVSQQILKVH